MQLIFDKNLETQRFFNVDTINEQLPLNRLTAGSNVSITEQGSFPEIDFDGNTAFSTVEAVSNGRSVPIKGHYNTILNLDLMYNERAGYYTVNILLGWTGENENG